MKLMNELFHEWRPFRLRKIQKQYNTEAHVALIIILTYYLLETISAQTTPGDSMSENSSTIVITPFQCGKSYFYTFTWNVPNNITNEEESLKIIETELRPCFNETSDNETYNSITVPRKLKFTDFVCVLPLVWDNISVDELNINNSYGIPDFIIKYCDCAPNTLKLLHFEWSAGNLSKILYSDDPNRKYKIDKIIIVDDTGYEQENIEWLARSDQTVVDVKFPNLTLYSTYNLSIFYFDESKHYCRYKSHFSSRLELPDAVVDEKSFNINYILLLLLLTFIALIIAYLAFKISGVHHGVLYKLKNCISPPEELPESVLYRIRSPKRSIHQESSSLYTPMEIIHPIPPTIIDSYEFPGEKVELKVIIGQGAFGKVYYAKAHGLYNPQGYAVVAVKVLRDNAPNEEINDFLSEIEMMKRVTKHRNVVRMFAYVTKSQPYMMIMELVISGNLKEYLLQLREIWSKREFPNQFFKDSSDCNYIEPGDTFKEIRNENGSYYIFRKNAYKISTVSKLPASDEVPVFKNEDKSPLPEEMTNYAKPVLDNKELENFALQIASGMAHLETLGITHRDLAARNVLVTRNKILKISDFGMSRFGTYVYRGKKRVPLRWMAIETLEKFAADSKSDVWSFGVVLWEIGTLGAIPYGRLDNNLILPYLKMGRRLLRPRICTDDLYSLMLKCWATEPKDRPSFKELVNTLAKKSSVYVEFSQINSNYVFPEVSRSEDY